MALLNRADSSNESLYDFSDELNESVHHHNFFSKNTLEDELQVPDSNGKFRRPRTFDEDSKVDDQNSASNKNLNQSLFSGIFSKLFTGGKKESVISITACATNGKSMIFGYSNGSCCKYDLSTKCLSDQVVQLSTSYQKVEKLETHHFITDDKEVKTTILITLINGIVKLWDYETLNLYSKLPVEQTRDFSYFKNNGMPSISLITRNKCMYIFDCKEFWTFTRLVKIKLKKTPLDFIMVKDKGIISYEDNYEFFTLIKDGVQSPKLHTQSLLSKTLIEKTAPIIYLESLRAFVISKSRCSYYVDKASGSINKGSSIKIVWREGTPINVFLVRPYLIGIMENAVEIKSLFNPNRVAQVIKGVNLTECKFAINKGKLEDTHMAKLDSLLIFAAVPDKDDPSLFQNCISELTQCDESELYSTAMKICDYLMNKNYEGLNAQEYQNFQKGRAFYSFFIKKDYKQSISLFRKVDVPIEEVILLFTELYPRYAIDQIIERFNIKIKNIPYLKDHVDIYNPAISSLIFESKRKRTVSLVSKSPMKYKMIKGSRDEKCICTSGKIKFTDKIHALQAFLLYFIDKK